MSSISTRLFLGFIAGALSHVIFQGALGTLYFAADMIPALPWSLKPLPPFGVPTTVNFAFWAGLWGIAYALVEPRLTARVGRLAGGLIFGVAALLVEGLQAQAVTVYVGFHLIFGIGLALIFGAALALARRNTAASPKALHG